ncbi:hypothetical protein EDD21DRAFT_137839 [Dissophora ornata]|nr:hypothetical protein EDD21DRAFT_137839 [Dissophora ornata]
MGCQPEAFLNAPLEEATKLAAGDPGTIPPEPIPIAPTAPAAAPAAASATASAAEAIVAPAPPSPPVTMDCELTQSEAFSAAPLEAAMTFAAGDPGTIPPSLNPIAPTASAAASLEAAKIFAAGDPGAKPPEAIAAPAAAPTPETTIMAGTLSPAAPTDCKTAQAEPFLQRRP